jgi:hypothetical protein
MSVQLSYLGTEYTTPDHAVGYGTAFDPATMLSGMVTGQLYFQEAQGDVDVVFVKGGDKFLLSCFKSFVNQKLLQQFCFSVTHVGGQDKLRLIHRNLATTFTLEQGLRAVGVNTTVSDDYSGTTSSINQQLNPLWIQIFKA